MKADCIAQDSLEYFLKKDSVRLQKHLNSPANIVTDEIFITSNRVCFHTSRDSFKDSYREIIGDLDKNLQFFRMCGARFEVVGLTAIFAEPYSGITGGTFYLQVKIRPMPDYQI